MAMLAGVGTSTENYAENAVSQALAKAVESLAGYPPSLLIVIASPTTYDQSKLLSECKKKYPDTEIVGCSSSGEITSAGPVDKSVAIAAIYSDQSTLVTGVGTGIKENPRKTGQEFANNILQKTNGEKPKVAVIFPDGLAGNGAEIVRGVLDIYGDDFKLAGGSAGDDFQFKQTYQYFNDKVLTNSITGFAIVGNVNFGIGVRHGWIPIGISRIVTKAVSNIVYELDGKPAIEIYEEHFGKDTLVIKSGEPFAKLAITYPIGILTPDYDEYLIRDPLSVDNNGAITFAAEIPLGSEVNLMIGSREEAINAAQTAAKNALNQVAGKNIKLAFLFNCIARKKLMMDKKKEEIERIMQVFGPGVPLIGFYTYGEQAPVGNNKTTCSFHNETDVILVITE